MSSSVFFKFKSQKDPQRILFDGNGITVFELKREIIAASKLGDGTDFDLSIYTEDAKDEYTDDTTIIPRSSTVIARRLPATRPGHGRAARYVSGKAPTTAKNAYRTEGQPGQTSQATVSKVETAPVITANMTEEERMAAIFQSDTSAWEKTREQMAHAKPTFNNNNRFKKQDAPDRELPPGYICYRCLKKGHFIQDCPTNGDPNHVKFNVKRTTGIPKSFLQTVEEPEGSSADGLGDVVPGTLFTPGGQRVKAVPDHAAWEQFQAKTAVNTAQKEAEESGSKELQDRGLECSIDKRMFVDPMKTPCCGKTYCNDCIENALVNSDLVCPNCSKDGVLIDDLVSDEEMIKKIKDYEKEKAEEKKPTEASKSPSPQRVEAVQSPTPPKSATNSPVAAKSTPDTSKKRKASEELPNERIPSAPKAMRQEQEQKKAMMQQNMEPLKSLPSDPKEFQAFMNNLAQSHGLAANQQMPSMQMQMQMPMPMSMPNMMNMNPYQNMNPMQGQGWNNQYNQYNQPNQWQNQHQNQWNNQQNMWNQQNQWNPQNQWNQQNQWQGQNQGTSFSAPLPNAEESAYQRQPVNPQRHMHRQQRRQRQGEWTELS
ncbi:DWNN-domain-containing protein [Aulographum hederae CBS 113979]|uniref:DWNN-domain-containing protein n=1 Tax=Aulographum hederae CBS 113979 TaxID=1176131 RepID=A0A6G1GTU9_9PEZI|nr:DWNN-domain-containing protein [Aulographum hederae CBS 113979]